MVKRIGEIFTDRKETVRLQTGEAGTPAAKKGVARQERVKKKDLENAYYSVPTIFNSVNKTTQFILSNNWELEGDNADFFNTFLDNIGELGGDMHWSELLERIFRDQTIYGEAFVELVVDRNTGKVVDLALVNPKTMDLAEDEDGNVAVDQFGNPLGYVQRINETRHIPEGDPVHEAPEGVSATAGEIFIPADRIAHFKLYTVGDGFRPVGLIEPVFQSAERSFQLKSDYAEKAHTTLFPLRVASVGDENHEPTPEKTHKILEELGKADSATEVALPYYIDLEMLEAENPEALIDFFTAFDNDMIAGMGQVKAFVRGEGGDVNRATLQSQAIMWQISMADIIKRTSKTIEHQIFKPVSETNDLGGFPTMEWDLDVDMLQEMQISVGQG